MYSENFLKSLGLDEWVKPQQPIITAQDTASQEMSAPTLVQVEPPGQVSTDLPTRAKNCPPRDCFNCEHSGQSDWCSLKEAQIEDLDEETSCPDFSIGIHCGHCGEYEDGLCHFKGIQKPKNPEDECEYDIRCFM